MSFNQLSDLFEQKELGIQQKIVEELLNEKNLDRKTELDNPLKWAILSTTEEVLKTKNMVKSQIILHNFTDFTMKYLISYKRKGRMEYIEALGNLSQPNIQQPVNDIMKK